MRVLPPASKADARAHALFLLEAATSELGGETFSELVGLPLLPLADGTLGRFLPPPSPPPPGVMGAAAGEGATVDAAIRAGRSSIFVCSSAERRLLAGPGRGGEGRGAGHRLLEDLEELSQVTRTLLTDKRVHAATNVAVMEPGDLAGMLDAVFPEAWKGLKQVAWAPGSRDVSSVHVDDGGWLIVVVALIRYAYRTKRSAAFCYSVFKGMPPLSWCDINNPEYGKLAIQQRWFVASRY